MFLISVIRGQGELFARMEQNMSPGIGNHLLIQYVQLGCLDSTRTHTE
jgi:hypothetical protein